MQHSLQLRFVDYQHEDLVLIFNIHSDKCLVCEHKYSHSHGCSSSIKYKSVCASFCRSLVVTHQKHRSTQAEPINEKET
jgi:hypothetical protein